jgi:hypothetical protein
MSEDSQVKHLVSYRDDSDENGSRRPFIWRFLLQCKKVVFMTFGAGQNRGIRQQTPPASPFGP